MGSAVGWFSLWSLLVEWPGVVCEQRLFGDWEAQGLLQTACM